MSMRNIRKLYGGNELPPLEGNSDEEYEPLYAKASAFKFKYEGLILSSHSESEQESTDAVGIENSAAEERNKKKKKIKKKKKLRKPKSVAGCSSNQNIEELDEIDKSVMEVNALLGTPPPAPSAPALKAPADPRVELFAVQAKHLNPKNELRKLFGPEEPGERRRGRQTNLNRLLRRAVIVPVTDTSNFQKSGLSMSIHRRENGYTYFAFDHSREYQRVHSAFLQIENYRNSSNLATNIEDAQRNMHVEGMLESADSMFRYEAYSVANTLIEQIIAYMQYIAHPSFNLTNPKVRLEYKITENRPFHIAVLKYLYLLTNRACHRTALELAKLLLNLDPSDPLAVLFIIDTLALRAREHQWLIQATAFWTKKRDAGFLFNIQYSNALAHYHVATKNKASLCEADSLLQAAMLRFPAVVPRLMACASAQPSACVRDCGLFANADDTTGKNLRDLMALYAKLAWSKWREPGVFEWFTGNADQLANQFNADANLQERASVRANERQNLFRGWPEQVVRHLTVIKPMSNFLVEGVVPRVNRARACDPVPPSGAGAGSRYGYELAPRAVASASPLYELVSSIMPHYALPPPPEFQRRVAEAVGRQAQEADDAAAIAAAAAAATAAAAMADADYDSSGDDDDDDDDDGAGNVDDVAAGRGQVAPADIMMSVEALTTAIQHLMGMYEAGREREDAPGPRPDAD